MSSADPIEQIQRKLRQHVLTDQLLGVQAVPVGQAAAHLLLPADVADRQPSTSPPAAADRRAGTPPVSPASKPGPLLPVARSEDRANPGGPTMGGRSLDRNTKLKILTAIDVNEVQSCTRCALCQSRTQTVFGGGDVDAGLMFVGEGPGQTEDELGKPFVGRAGDLLTKMIQAMGLTREQVYITNVVKCRPPNNRTPAPGEVEACSDYLRRQILTICPKVIVTLGGPATKHLLQTREGITRLRGQWHEYQGLLPEGPPVPVMPTFHPAYLLRAYTKENRARVWSDLQAAMQRL